MHGWVGGNISCGHFWKHKKSILVMSTYNHFHNILRLFDVLRFSFHHKWNDARLWLINMVYEFQTDRAINTLGENGTIHDQSLRENSNKKIKLEGWNCNKITGKLLYVSIKQSSPRTLRCSPPFTQRPDRHGEK